LNRIDQVDLVSERASPAPLNKGNQVVDCAIIGFGKMGRIRAKSLEESGRARIAGVFDSSPKDSGPYKFYASEQSILDDADVGAIFICTPNYRIVPLCKAALAAGKHVFCEKPPAFSAAEVKEVMAVEAASGKVLMYGFNHRHHESVQRMKAIIDSGDMGRILWMRGRYGKEVDESFFRDWRAKKELAGGGILLDQGIHMLDLFLYLAGDFDEVQAMVSNLFWKIDGIEDNVFAQFRSRKTGICASLHSTMTQWRYLFSLEIFLERGSLVLNGLKTSSGAYGDEDLSIKHNQDGRTAAGNRGEVRHVFHTDTSWAREIKLFLDAIRNGGYPETSNSIDALKVMTIVDQVYRDRISDLQQGSAVCGGAL